MPTSDEKKRDAILKRMLETPPTPHKPSGKKKVAKKTPPAKRKAAKPD